MNTRFLRDNQDMEEQFDELIEGLRERFENERCYKISVKQRDSEVNRRAELVTLNFEFVKPYEQKNPETGYKYIDGSMGRNY